MALCGECPPRGVRLALRGFREAASHAARAGGGRNAGHPRVARGNPPRGSIVAVVACGGGAGLSSGGLGQRRCPPSGVRRRRAAPCRWQTGRASGRTCQEGRPAHDLQRGFLGACGGCVRVHRVVARGIAPRSGPAACRMFGRAARRVRDFVSMGVAASRNPGGARRWPCGRSSGCWSMPRKA